jgi:VIT1/CCC1 family predicted Fe2+/Mn2+ transporter
VATITTDDVVTEGQTLEQRLHVRWLTLKENREKFIQEAQRNLAALDGAIAELGALLDPAPAPAGLNGASDAETT